MEFDKHLGINISIWTIRFVVGDINFVRRSNNASFWPQCTEKRVLYIRARVLGLPYKEMYPPLAEIFSLAETKILPCPVGLI